jgi:hypothetical protein
MAIAIKNIKNIFIFSDKDNREIECYDGRYANIALHFEAGEHRYHVWMTHSVARGWQLGATLYKNLIVQPKFGKYKTGKLEVQAHRAAVDHAIKAMNIGQCNNSQFLRLDSDAITQIVEAHNARVRDVKRAATDAANAVRATTIRQALAEFALSDRIVTTDVIAALSMVAAQASNDELNALDHLFNVKL